MGDMTRNYNLAVKPQTESAMVNSGSFGNSGLAQMQGEQQRQLAQELGRTATNMRFSDYQNRSNLAENDLNRRQAFNLGLGGLQLGNRQADINQTQVGANLMQQGNAGTLGQGQGIYNLGVTAQQAPWQSYQNFGNVAQPYTGFGSNTSTQTGSPAAGFLGGAIGGSQLYNIFK